MSDKNFMITSDEKQMLGIVLFWSVALFLGVALGATSAKAQMNNEPWGFKPQNRASIAALMRQVEEDNDGTGNGAIAASAGDALVCGGGEGSSSATGNSTCIILNNSDGAIQIGQDANGDQGATNTESTTVNETLNSGLSDILEDMEG